MSPVSHRVHAFRTCLGTNEYLLFYGKAAALFMGKDLTGAAREGGMAQGEEVEGTYLP